MGQRFGARARDPKVPVISVVPGSWIRKGTRSTATGRGGGGGHQQEHHDLFADIRKGIIPNEGEYGALSSMTSILGRMATYSGQEIEWKTLSTRTSLSHPSTSSPAWTTFRPRHLTKTAITRFPCPESLRSYSSSPRRKTECRLKSQGTGESLCALFIDSLPIGAVQSMTLSRTCRHIPDLYCQG